MTELEPLAPTAKEIFLQAVELPADERAVFVNEQCATDESLLAKVQMLLANHDEDSGFLEDPALNVDVSDIARWSAPDELLVGERINGWTIDRVIATGGMGAVYQASDETNGDTVAIKLMRAGVTSDAAMRRFRFEADVLSRLQHDGIAKVLDTGTHDGGSGGVPFFVMEYVADAKTIAEHVRERKLDARANAGLFAKVCDAVHHGHQKGVIHRDLKPANILVDAGGDPKVIDFGVARATDSDLAVKTLVTSVGQLLGTLQYMSPEQCGTDPGAVDVRSDVYSLGVVLYELLCGDAPYDVRDVGVLEAVRRIREQMPRNPREVAASVPADLATIAMKAIEKEPERRYQSAAELAADLRRFINNEPISARPPSLMYQLKTFARRNRAIVTSTGAFIFILMLAVVGLLVQNADIRGFATELVNLNETLTRSQGDLQTKASSLDEVHELLHDMVLAMGPDAGSARTRDEVALETLEHWSRNADEWYADAPLLRAAIHHQISKLFDRPLNRPFRARDHAQIAYSIRLEHLGQNHYDTIDSGFQYAYARWQLLEKEGLLSDVEDLHARAVEFVGHEDELTLAILGVLAEVLDSYGQSPDALPIRRQALGGFLATKGQADESTMAAHHNLAQTLFRLRYDVEAVHHYREALAIADEIDTDPHNVINTKFHLADVLGRLGERAEARSLIDEANELIDDAFGSHEEFAFYARRYTAQNHRNSGQIDESIPLLRQNLEYLIERYGETHARTHWGRIQLAGRLEAEEPAEALELARTVLAHLDDSKQYNVGLFTKAWDVVAHASDDLQKYEEAEEAFSYAINKTLEVSGPGDAVAVLQMCYADYLRAHNRRDESIELSRTVYEQMRERLGDANTRTREAGLRLTRVLGPCAESADIFQRLVQVCEEYYGVEHPKTLDTKYGQARNLELCGRLDEAIELLAYVVDASRRILGLDDPRTMTTMSRLADYFEANVIGRRDEAVALRREILDQNISSLQAADADASKFNDVAWELLTHKYEELRDPARALGFATRACALEESNSGDRLYYYLDTLALAQHTMGDIKSAVETQRRAVDLMPEDDPDRQYYLDALQRYEQSAHNESDGAEG